MRRVGGYWKTALRALRRFLPLRSRRPGNACDEKLRILALVPKGPNQLVLRTTSANAGWALTVSDSTSDTFLWPRSVPPIVIYDREMSPQHWCEMVRAFAKKSPRPYIILLSPSSDANLWDELQRAGGSEILRTPINQDHLLWALVKAWQLWRTQQRVRPPLTPLMR